MRFLTWKMGELNQRRARLSLLCLALAAHSRVTAATNWSDPTVANARNTATGRLIVCWKINALVREQKSR